MSSHVVGTLIFAAVVAVVVAATRALRGASPPPLVCDKWDWLTFDDEEPWERHITVLRSPSPPLYDWHCDDGEAIPPAAPGSDEWLDQQHALSDRDGRR